MANFLWPGDVRAGDLFSDETFLAAMVAVEEAWLDALAASGIAPATVAKLDLQSLVKPFHREWLANEAEATGNPAAALVELLRDGLEDDSVDGARWLHRGLTSQDVVDTALMLCAGDAIGEVVAELGVRSRAWPSWSSATAGLRWSPVRSPSTPCPRRSA